MKTELWNQFGQWYLVIINEALDEVEISITPEQGKELKYMGMIVNS